MTSTFAWLKNFQLRQNVGADRFRTTTTADHNSDDSEYSFFFFCDTFRSRFAVVIRKTRFCCISRETDIRLMGRGWSNCTSWSISTPFFTVSTSSWHRYHAEEYQTPFHHDLSLIEWTKLAPFLGCYDNPNHVGSFKFRHAHAIRKVNAMPNHSKYGLLILEIRFFWLFASIFHPFPPCFPGRKTKSTDPFGENLLFLALAYRLVADGVPLVG